MKQLAEGDPALGYLAPAAAVVLLGSVGGICLVVAVMVVLSLRETPRQLS
jgi:hypothetical protein